MPVTAIGRQTKLGTKNSVRPGRFPADGQSRPVTSAAPLAALHRFFFVAAVVVASCSFT